MPDKLCRDEPRLLRLDEASPSFKGKHSWTQRLSLLFLLAFLLNAGFARAQTINVDPSMANQTFEGWGTSLAVFATEIGGWSNTTNRNNLMQALFSPTDGLGLTYLRYNIGGGNDPLCGTGGTHYACITPSYSAAPGYEPVSGTYNWNADANQRLVAKYAQSLGANLIEGYSNSPPYWMTISGTTEGGVNDTPNLAPSYYGSGPGTFADYLTTVTDYYDKNFGITFHHLEPMNESGKGGWIAGNTKQEGCDFSPSGQAQIIRDVQASLAGKGSVTQVSAMDEFQEGSVYTVQLYTSTTANEFLSYDSAAQSDINEINTHAYSSPLGSSALATLAQYYGKRLTMSEWGTGDTTGVNLSNQIMSDIYLTRPAAWVIWQPGWSEIMGINDSNQTYTNYSAYYVFEQFTKFIRPGFQFIAISDPQSLAAFNQQTNTLVIVTQNWSSSPRNVSYQLSNFTGIGATAAVYQTRTAAGRKFTPLSAIPISNGSFGTSVGSSSVTTFVIKGVSYLPPATTVNDNTTGTSMGRFNYSGAWTYDASLEGAYNGDNHSSSTTNDYYTFQFSGQQARVYASMAPDGGILAFSVDNGGEIYFDTYAATRTDNVSLFATSTLPQGVHTLKVRVTGLKNPASTGYNVSADRIDVIAGGTAVGQGIYKIANINNGLDLDVSSGSLDDGGRVDTYQDVPGAKDNLWNLMAVGDGSYRIVNVNSGLNLEVSGSSMSLGATVDQWEDTGPTARNAHWNIIPVGDGYRIVNVNSGLDLEIVGTTGDVDQGTNVQGATNNQWTLTAISAEPVVGTTTTITSSANPSLAGSGVTFTANVTSPNGSNIPTGIVNFLDGVVILNSASLDSTGSATYTATSLTAGSHSITVAYEGDASNLASTSSVLTQVVGVPVYMLGIAPSTLTIADGQAGTAKITITPSGGFNSQITLGCSGLPAYATCEFSPSSIIPDGTNTATTATLTITTSVQNASEASSTAGGKTNEAAILSLLGICGFIPFCRRSGRKSYRSLMLALIVLLGIGAATLTGCGSGVATKATATPLGTSMVTVTASSGGVNQSVNLTLIVQ